jgi:glycosyltransferase involved in cell wall biosynthesis
MNLGGPAYHVSLLSSELDPRRYETLLVTGKVGRGEASFIAPRTQQNLRLHVIKQLGPAIRPWSDLRALVALMRVVRRFRPHIVHTHTAKAGMLGRLAAVVAVRPRPIVVHTYHGHVLEDYFGPITRSLYRFLERALARKTDLLICVSEADVADLRRYRVAPPAAFRVVRLGFDLDEFLALDPVPSGALRDELGADGDDVVLTYVGRFARIKRIDLLLRSIADANRSFPRFRLALAGDGESRPALEAFARELGISSYVRFLGYRADLVEILAGTDVAVLSSDREGTPVSLIQAAAAARPLVSTDAGGVREVVDPRSGLVVPRGDASAFARALNQLGDDPALRVSMGRQARESVRNRFASGRLLDEIACLYEELATRRDTGLASGSSGVQTAQAK